MLKNGARVEISRCLFCRDVTVCLSFSNFLRLAVGWSLTCQPRCMTRKIFASPVERTLLWSRWQQNMAGPLKRPSPSTIASLQDITGSSTSCYVPQTSNSSETTTLRSFINTTSMCHSKFFHYSVESPYWLSSCDVIILVMILCLNSQQNRFCDASKRVRPLIGASDLRRIYMYNNMVKCQPPIAYT